MGKEVDASLAEEPAVFEGLVRRDVPGEKIRVRVEVGSEKVRYKIRPIDVAVCYCCTVLPLVTAGMTEVTMDRLHSCRWSG